MKKYGSAQRAERIGGGTDFRSSRSAFPPAYKKRRFSKGAFLLLMAAVLIAAASYKLFYEKTPGRSSYLTLEATTLKMLLPELPRQEQGKISHRVRPGETLGTIVTRYGLAPTDSAEIQKALEGLSKQEPEAGTLRSGQVFEFALDAAGSISEVQTGIGVGVRVRLERNSDGTYRGAVEQLPRFEREKVAVGVITSSFAAAAARTGVQYDVIDDFVDLFSDRIRFHQDFRVGDRFTIIYRDRVLDDGTPIQAGPILAAAVTVDGKQLVAVRYVGSDGKGRYFDAAGELLGNAFLRYPLKFSRISSYFSTARFHPVLRRNRPHHGVDFAAPTGTPVRTVADGRVVFAGDKGPNGLMVKIEHTPRYSTAYVHLSRIEKGVRRGARVQRGAVIGAVGMTGLATGPHLHYSFYDNGRYVDPLKIKLPTVDDLGKGMRAGKKYLEKVLFTLEHYQSVNLKNFMQGL